MVAILAGFLPARAGDEATASRRREPPPAEGSILFSFNGKNLDGFSTFLRYQKQDDPAQVFAVVNGCLRISGAEFGGITTDQSFANYHLVAEWRWGGATHYPRRWLARNSGILIHCSGRAGDGLGSWMASLESQLIEGGCGDFIIVPGKNQPPMRFQAEVRTGDDGQPYYDPGGKVVDRAKGRLNWWGRDPAWADLIWFRGPRDVDHPVGAWNRTELVANGDRVTCYLNGQVVNAVSHLSPTSGRVLFQSEGAEILFRKIEIRSLPPATP